jgi:hypothetical protein
MSISSSGASPLAFSIGGLLDGWWCDTRSWRFAKFVFHEHRIKSPRLDPKSPRNRARVGETQRRQYSSRPSRPERSNSASWPVARFAGAHRLPPRATRAKVEVVANLPPSSRRGHLVEGVATMLSSSLELDWDRKRHARSSTKRWRAARGELSSSLEAAVDQIFTPPRLTVWGRCDFRCNGRTGWIVSDRISTSTKATKRC